jgi:hypothetical protein
MKSWLLCLLALVSTSAFAADTLYLNCQQDSGAGPVLVGHLGRAGTHSLFQIFQSRVKPHQMSGAIEYTKGAHALDVRAEDADGYATVHVALGRRTFDEIPQRAIPFSSRVTLHLKTWQKLDDADYTCGLAWLQSRP